MLEFTHENDRYAKTTFVTWKITLENIMQIGDQGKGAIEILEIMAYLAPDNVPIEDFFSRLAFDEQIIGEESENEEVSHELNKVSINVYVCDICSEESINDSLKNIDNKFGNIEVLVNSAAINSDKLLISASSGLINDIIDTNLKATIFMCKAILKQMIRQRKGSIVNIDLTLN